jgi:antitoxin HicB
MTANIKHYMELPYAVEIVPDDGGYLASIPDLPGCMSSGTTAEEALKGLAEAKELWIEGRIEAGEPIPEPSEESEYSGKFVLRIPRALHRSLDREAKKQGVSLNQYLVHLLSERRTLAALEGELQVMLTASRTGTICTRLEPDWYWADDAVPGPVHVPQLGHGAASWLTVLEHSRCHGKFTLKKALSAKAGAAFA